MGKEGLFHIVYRELEHENGYRIFYTDSEGSVEEYETYSSDYNRMLSYYHRSIRVRMPDRIRVTTGKRWYERVDGLFLDILARKLNDKTNSENRFYVDDDFLN